MDVILNRLMKCAKSSGSKRGMTKVVSPLRSASRWYGKTKEWNIGNEISLRTCTSFSSRLGGKELISAPRFRPLQQPTRP